MNNIKFYIDFDRTIFDTDGLGLEVRKLREKYCIEESIWAKYVKKHKDGHNGLFNMYMIMYMICMYENKDFNILNELNNLIIEKSEALVFDDAKRFLKELKSLNLELNMLTYGDCEFQGKKIINTEIYKDFDNVIITPINKYQIDDRVDYKHGIFFDDNPKDVEGIYEREPLNIIRIRRDNVKYSDIDLKYPEIIECKSFDDLYSNNFFYSKTLIKK